VGGGAGHDHIRQQSGAGIGNGIALVAAVALAFVPKAAFTDAAVADAQSEPVVR
jgi:hypothetical protein